MDAISDVHAEMRARCRTMKDVELISELKFIVEREKRNLAGLLIHLAEYDLRRLYRDAGYPSLFAYCVKSLGYDENTAYRLITAGRVLKHYPAACPLVASGDLTLTAILVLSPVLTDENNKRLLSEVKGKSRRELETIVAGIAPHPARPDFVQPYQIAPAVWMKAAGASPACTTVEPERGEFRERASPLIQESTEPREWQAVIPISLDRVRIGFDAALVVLQLLDRAKQVLSHKYPDGKIEDIMRDALELLLERRDPQRKFARQSSEPQLLDETREAKEPLEPRFLRAWKAGRYIPASVKRAVWQRDDGRCAFRFEEGNICGSKDGLEFDHVRPFAKGGRSESSRNVRLLCRLHNRMASEFVFGMPLPGAADIRVGPVSA